MPCVSRVARVPRRAHVACLSIILDHTALKSPSLGPSSSDGVIGKIKTRKDDTRECADVFTVHSIPKRLAENTSIMVKKHKHFRAACVPGAHPALVIRNPELSLSLAPAQRARVRGGRLLRQVTVRHVCAVLRACTRILGRCFSETESAVVHDGLCVRFDVRRADCEYAEERAAGGVHTTVAYSATTYLIC